MTSLSFLFLVLFILTALTVVMLLFLLQRQKNQLKKSGKHIQAAEDICLRANDALFIINIVNGKIIYANHSAAQMLGYTRENMEQMTVYSIFPKHLLVRSSEIIADVWEKNGMVFDDIPLVDANGTHIDAECSGKVLELGDEPTIVLYVRDIRERLQMQQEIIGQKEIIELKNKQITDSINYARQIQQALLPSAEEVSAVFRDIFIMYRPKDIVSGDFYWMTRKKSRLFILVADCTGHGVPGALMSMIGHSLFNEVIVEKGEENPGIVLDKVRKGVINVLRQTGGISAQKDGMDVSLCVIDEKAMTLSFAGAHNSAWLMRTHGQPLEGKCETQELSFASVHEENRFLYEIEACKMPVGYFDEQRMRPFFCKEIKLCKGDTLYLHSDGYADQFGGPKGKKFMKKNFKSLLFSLHNKTLPEQKKTLEENFDAWKGAHEQVDDVCVIGVKC